MTDIDDSSSRTGAPAPDDRRKPDSPPDLHRGT